MKKFTLFAATALAAISVNAQNILTGDDVFVKNSVGEGNQVFDVVVMGNDAFDALVATGKTVNDYRPDDVTRWLYYWNGLSAVKTDFPGVGFDSYYEVGEGNGYTAVKVNPNPGWTGAGYNINRGAGVDMSHINGETRFHACFRSSNPPSSLNLTVLDMDNPNSTTVGLNIGAKIALGTGDAEFKAVGPQIGEEWIAIDMSLAEIKKAYVAFDYERNASDAWTGNILAFLPGIVGGTNVSIDAVYFYTTLDNSGIEDITVDNADAPVEYYNIQGMRVENPANGLFIRRQGSSVTKVIL